jgi:hypothetical protein
MHRLATAVLASDVNGRSASTREGFYHWKNGKLCALGITELTLENMFFFFIKLQQNLVLLLFIQADDMFRPLF